MDKREIAASHLIEVYHVKCAAMALYKASAITTDKLLSESNDVFFAASNCEDFQRNQFDRALRRFELAMIDFRAAMPECGPFNWLNMAYSIKRQVDYKAEKAMIAFLGSI